MKLFFSTLLVVLFCSTLISGCSSELKCIRKEFRGTFKNEINLENKIRYDGYYYRSDTNINGNYWVFYRNGLVAYGCSVSFPYDSLKLNRTIQPCGLWGTYLISGDTVKVRCTGHGTWMVPYGAFERWFLVRDNEHLEPIVLKSICHETSDNNTSPQYQAIFAASDKLPKFEDCWLLREKWFWKNENDWKQFIDSLKKQK